MIIKDFLRSLAPEKGKKERHYQELAEIAAGPGPIVFGPFFTEIGFETLYWIPFLNWFKTEFRIPSERILAISRGGAHPWYRHVAGRYVDIFDHYSLSEFKEKNEERIVAGKLGGQGNAAKHRTVSSLDREILERVCQANGITDHSVLHPSHMFKVMGIIRSSPDLAWSRFQIFEKEDVEDLRGKLPDDYVAVKFWFGGQFPENESNKAFVRNIIRTLAATNKVVLLNTGLDVERHQGFDKWFNDLEVSESNVFSIRPYLTLENNLRVQTAVIARSKAFVGTYGGFAYIAPFAGVPAVTFFSREEGFVYEHMDLLRRALRQMRLKGARQAELFSFDVSHFDYFVDNLFRPDLINR
jgi:hypothetical protein